LVGVLASACLEEESTGKLTGTAPSVTLPRLEDVTMNHSDPSKPKRRWYHLRPPGFFVALLIAEGLLLLSERFRWFAFNEKKGWTVLIAVGVAGLAVLIVLLSFGIRWVAGRRVRYSLRTLLLFMVVLTVPLGWFARETHRAKRQREVVGAIHKAGGGVFYDYEFDETGLPIPGAQPTGPMWLRKSLGDDFFCDVIWVNLRATQVADVAIERLKGLTSLKWLSLEETDVTGEGFEDSRGLTSLRSLYLDNTQVTDTGLKHLLKGLTSLEELHVGDTAVTDAGLEHVKGLTSLRWLVLSDTQVTDAGIEHLKGLTSLEWLNLENTHVTDEALEKLHETLPNCEVHH